MLEASWDVEPFGRAAGLSMVYYPPDDVKRETGNDNLVNPLKIPKMHKADMTP